VRKMKADGFGPTEIAKALGIGRASVYRLLGTGLVHGYAEGSNHA
jgi:DNA invertase Pin-like site-specific DNA recombinase